MPISVGKFCSYLSVINLSRQNVDVAIGQSLQTTLEFESSCHYIINPGLSIELRSPGPNMWDYERIMTGAHTALILYDRDSQSRLERFLRDKEADFLWLSGMTEQRLENLEQDHFANEPIAVHLHHTVDVTIIPTTAQMIRRFSSHWSDRFTPARPKDQRVTDRVIIHFIWLSKTPGSSCTPLNQVQLKRFLSWVDKNGTDCDYWVWTDTDELSSLNIESTIKYIREKYPNISVELKYYSAQSSFLCEQVRAGFDCLISSSRGELIPKLDEVHSSVLRYLACSSVGVRADILRLILLYVFGGLYVDINDMECIQPISEWGIASGLTVCMEPDGTINTAIIYSTPGNKVILSLLFNAYLAQPRNSALEFTLKAYESLMKNANDKELRVVRNALDSFVVQHTGPVMMTKTIFTALDCDSCSKEITILPPSYWYPGWGLMSAYAKVDWIKTNSWANHYDERSFTEMMPSGKTVSEAVALGDVPGGSQCSSKNKL